MTAPNNPSGGAEMAGPELTEEAVLAAVAKGRRGERDGMTMAEQDAWAGYELGWRDGRKDASRPAPPIPGDLPGLSDRFWLVLREPGCIPERKGPWKHTEAAKVLREFMRARPTAVIDLLTVSYDGPDVQHGPEALQMLDGRSRGFGRRHNARVREAEALSTQAAQDEDETYQIGKRDGYEAAIQSIDEQTGGDGEFRGSTDPSRTVDVPIMEARIIERFSALRTQAGWRPDREAIAQRIEEWLQGMGVNINADLSLDDLLDLGDAVLNLYPAPPLAIETGRDRGSVAVTASPAASRVSGANSKSSGGVE